jgi:hypothetical protein
LRQSYIEGNEPGAWTFVDVPKELAPSHTHAWGRCPVIATVDGKTWKTSVWKGKDGKTYLPVPKKIRGNKTNGDSVKIVIEYESPIESDLRKSI